MASVINRRRSNSISSLMDSVGNWIYDFSAIKDHITSHFRSIFSPSATSPFSSLNLDHPPFSWDLSCLAAPLSDVEIKTAVWSIKPFKAAGIDGFQAGFYQKFWDIVGPLVTSSIKHAFSFGTFPPTWNQTLICLIPKVFNPTIIKNFRPISLCTSH